MTPPLTFAIFKLYVIWLAIGGCTLYAIGWSLYYLYRRGTVYTASDKTADRIMLALSTQYKR